MSEVDSEMDIASFANALQEQGINVSIPEIIQTFLEAEDTYSVNDGKTIKVYQHGTDDLLITIPV